MKKKMLLADDLNQLLDVLPTFISGPLEKHSPTRTINRNCP